MLDTNFAGLSEEEKQRQLAAAMSRYENLGYTYRDERQRQQKAMEKKLAMRRQRLERTRRIKMMYGEEQHREAIKDATCGIQAELSRLARGQEFDENDELLRRLKAWATGRETVHKLAMSRKLRDKYIDLDPTVTANLIRKLARVEEKMKQLRKARKRAAKKAAKDAAKLSRTVI